MKSAQWTQANARLIYATAVEVGDHLWDHRCTEFCSANGMKHDPLSVRVSEIAYTHAVKTFEQFWEQLMDIEARSFA